MSTLTVVVTDGTDRAADVQQIAARWARQGLLQESVWLTVGDASIPTSGPPSVSARMLGVEGEGELQDLFTMIAVRRLDLVRFVVLQLLPHGEARDTELLGVATRVAELVKGALPRDVTVAHGGGTALVRTNVLVPETGAGEVSQELLAAGWEVNAIASPEDRPDLDHASIFVRTAVNFHAHAVAAVACVGGLWPGVAQGAFDDIEVDSTSGEPDLVVFRPSARVLLGDQLPRQLADRAIALVQDRSGAGASALVPWAAAAQKPDELVERAHSELIEQGSWAGDWLPDTPDIPKSEVGFKEAFGDLARFEGRLVLAAGRVIRNTATRWVEDKATRVTAGSEGSYVVRVQPQTPDQLVQRAQDRLDEQTTSLQSGQLEREALKVQPPPPSTWGQLRQLCFGLVDGSELPAGLTRPERTSMREILPPSAILPHPEDSFVASDGTVVGPVDIHRATNLRLRLQSENLETSGAAGEPGDVEGHAEAQEIDESGRLDEWVSRRGDTLVWRLGHTLWRREQHSNRTADEAYQRAMQASAPSAEAVRKSRTRLLLCWALTGVSLLAAGLWTAVVLRITGSLESASLWTGLAVLVVAAVIFALYGGWQYYRALSKFERQVQDLLAERRYAGEVYVAASRETRRLDLLYRGVMDWAQVIGWLLHEPWAPDTPTHDQAPLDMDDLPASVAIAVPAPGADEIPIDLIDHAITELCTRGWINRLFDDLLAEAVDRSGRRDAALGHLPADLDAGVTNHGARRQLMNGVASTELRMRLAGNARERIAGWIADGTLETPVREVVRLGDYASPESISDLAFFRGALGPATPFVQEVWTDQGMQDRCNLVARSVAWIPARHADGGEGGAVQVRRSAGDSSVRVDISRPCTPTQIALLDSGVRAVRPRLVVSEGWV